MTTTAGIAWRQRAAVSRDRAKSRHAGRTQPPTAILTLVAIVAITVFSTGTATGQIKITKEPDEQFVASGCAATFDISVWSEVTFDLRDVDVMDPLTPDCERRNKEIDVFSVLSYSCSTGAVSASFLNTASVTGVAFILPGDPGWPTSDSDLAFVQVLATGIGIKKTPATQDVLEGETAVFTIRVTNTGESWKEPSTPERGFSLRNISVVDPATPGCDRDAAFFASEDPDFQPGDVVTYTCSSGPLTTSLTSTATATGTFDCAPLDGTVTASASAEVVVLTPSITLEKATNGADADTAPGPTLAVGAPVDWTYVVTNTGGVALANVVVTDDQGVTVTCPASTLAINESMTCTASGMAQAGPYENEGTVTAEPLAVTDTAAKNGAVVTDSDLSHYTGDPCFGSDVVSGCLEDGPFCHVTSAVDISVGSVAEPPPPGLQFPFGLLDLTVESCEVGGTVDFTLTYPSTLPAGTQYWKYGPTPGDMTDHWYALPATISGNTVEFSITDGGLGDHDLTADGTILDPGGPAAPAPVPTVPQWALISLAAALLAMGAWLGRRRVLR